MTKALLTYAAGAARDTAALTRPALQRYADRHGYQLICQPAPEITVEGRSAHWTKVRMLQAALDDFAAAVWVDHDILVRDARHDVFAGVHQLDMHGLVMEQTPHGPGPNTGVWALRSSAQARAFLAQVWETGPLPDAQLNDQATVAHLLGFSYLPALTRPLRGSPWLAHTSWLDPAFNALLCYHPEQATVARFLHYGGLPEADKRQLIRYHIISQRLPGWERLLDELGFPAAPPPHPRAG